MYVRSHTPSPTFSFSNSTLLAFGRFKKLLVYSITAACIPRQIPKNGILFSLAYRTASTLPSMPLTPKPPNVYMEKR